MYAIRSYYVGLIFLRLAGAFMAIGTLGFAFFIGTIVNNVPIFNGRTGFSLPPNNLFGRITSYNVCYTKLLRSAAPASIIRSSATPERKAQAKLIRSNQ